MKEDLILYVAVYCSTDKLDLRLITETYCHSLAKIKPWQQFRAKLNNINGPTTPLLLLTNWAKRSLNTNKVIKQKSLGYMRRADEWCYTDFVEISIYPETQQPVYMI